MNIKLLVAVAASISLSACSTIVNGSNQLVKFDTGEVQGASCVATGGSSDSVNESFVTPAEVKIPRSKKILIVTCDKPGYQTGEERLAGQVEGSTGGNILLGGPLGVGVDALTGAIYKYPDTISVEMLELGVTSPTVTGEPIT